MSERTEGQMENEKMDRWMNERMVEWMEKWMEKMNGKVEVDEWKVSGRENSTLGKMGRL